MIPNNITFLTIEDVIELHSLQLTAYGGKSGIRDLGLLESAVMTPQASFDGKFVHNTIFEMASAYSFHIAENQPFIDGNKRTALASSLVFLDWLGYEIHDTETFLYDAMIGISSRTLSKVGFSELLEKLSVKFLD